MDTTILVAKVLGIYLVVSGFFIIFRGRTLHHLLRDFFDHPAMTYLTGVILIFISSLYLLQYNIWDGSPSTLVTIFVWLVFFKGLTYIFYPKALNDMALKNPMNSFKAYGFVALVVGLYLFFLN